MSGRWGFFRTAAVLCLWVVCATKLSAQVTALGALHQSGQTFLTWNESVGANEYRVYRSDSPIVTVAGAEFLGVVDDASSENRRLTQLSGTTTFFQIADLGVPLTSNDGLFVHTVEVSGDSYYAVTPVVTGVEDMTITAGANSLQVPVSESVATPRPVLQSIDGSLRHYVHWVSDRDTPQAPAMWNRPSRAFNFRVVFDPTFEGPRPVLLRLHARGGNFQLPGDFLHPEAVVVSPDDWIGEEPQNTFWYGMNEAFPDTSQYDQHPNVDYTVRRVMAELDFVLEEPTFECDLARIYASGSSMGAVGSVFLGYRFPDRFVAVHLVVPKYDFSCSENQCWLEPENGDLLWGPVAENLPTTDGVGVYDRLNIGFLVAQSPATDFPIVTASQGRNDIVTGWPEKPTTFAAVTEARQPAVFFWDESEHNGMGAVWGFTMFQRRSRMWDLRLDQPLPAFSSLSIDDDPGDGDPLVGDLVGCINCTVDWDLASAVDTPQQHQVVCSLRDTPGMDSSPVPSATVDWTPRRLQQFPRIPGEPYLFRNEQQPAGTEIENRIVVADSEGVITVAGATITQQGNRFTLERVVALPEFRRGDADQNGTAALADALVILSFLFTGGDVPDCRAAADVNDDEVLGLPDAIFLLNYLFLMGIAPPQPGPLECGTENTPILDCVSYTCS